MLDTLNIHITTGVHYTDTCSPMCERENPMVERKLRVLMQHEGTKDWVRLLLWAVLTMNSRWSSAIGYSPRTVSCGAVCLVLKKRLP